MTRGATRLASSTKITITTSNSTSVKPASGWLRLRTAPSTSAARRTARAIEFIMSPPSHRDVCLGPVLNRQIVHADHCPEDRDDYPRDERAHQENDHRLEDREGALHRGLKLVLEHVC